MVAPPWSGRYRGANSHHESSSNLKPGALCAAPLTARLLRGVWRDGLAGVCTWMSDGGAALVWGAFGSTAGEEVP